ncbi:acetyl-CoA carboxylase biotin carboxylase subunit, partial [Bacteroides faecis]|nr:acetyl-CoA carboxylase biotin carboxylase subunit [Bacteroides faecis]
MRTSERSENVALIAAYMDYLMNLEENNSGMATDNRPISKWKEFGLHKGVLRI